MQGGLQQAATGGLLASLSEQDKGAGACDACRLRKIKCVRPDRATQQCRPCLAQSLPCTVTYKRKRPGPRPGYADKLPVVAPPPAPGQSDLGNTAMASSPLDLSDILIGGNGGNIPAASPDLTFMESPPDGFFETTISRPMLSLVIDMFFDYVHCLVPFPRQSDFMADLHNRRENRPDQKDWSAMVLAMVAFTISLVPHQLLPLDKPALRKIAENCVARAKDQLSQPFATASMERFFTVYCIGFVCHNLGQHMVAREYHGVNVSAALSIGMDRESFYTSSACTDQELYRRLWWLIYTGDRSAALSEGGRMLIGDDSVIDVAEPSTVPAVLSQSGLSSESRLAGFGCITRIWRRELLTRREWDYRKPPSGAALRLRLAEIEGLLDKLEHVLDDLPDHLRIGSKTHLSPGSFFSFPDFLGVPTYAEGSLMISDEPQRAFVIQQANIHITQQCVLFMGVHYQEYLFGLSMGHRVSTATFHYAKHKILADLLQILQTLPLDLIAVNALPGVSKIRLVAASLLTETEGQEGSAEDGAMRVHHYLVQYLEFLSKIENLYSLNGDSSEVL